MIRLQTCEILFIAYMGLGLVSALIGQQVIAMICLLFSITYSMHAQEITHLFCKNEGGRGSTSGVGSASAKPKRNGGST